MEKVTLGKNNLIIIHFLKATFAVHVDMVKEKLSTKPLKVWDPLPSKNYSDVSHKRTTVLYAYLISLKNPPCTLLLETCTLIHF